MTAAEFHALPELEQLAWIARGYIPPIQPPHPITCDDEGEDQC